MRSLWILFYLSFGPDLLGRQNPDKGEKENTKEIVEKILPKLLRQTDCIDKIHQLLYVNDPNGYFKWTAVFKE